MLDYKGLDRSTFINRLCDMINVDYEEYTKNMTHNSAYDYNIIKPFIRSCFLDYKTNGNISEVGVKQRPEIKNNESMDNMNLF